MSMTLKSMTLPDVDDIGDENHLDGSKFNSKSIGDWGRDQTGEGDWPSAGVKDEEVHRARTGVGGDEAEI